MQNLTQSLFEDYVGLFALKYEMGEKRIQIQIFCLDSTCVL